MNATIATILAIGFWLIAGMGLVTLMAFVYCEVQYYRWNKQEREAEKMSETVNEAVKNGLRDIMETIASKANEITEADETAYGDIENDEEAEAHMMQDY